MTSTRLMRKERPTNRDLQDQIQEVHDCTHALGEEVRRDRHDSKTRDQVLGSRQQAMQKILEEMERRLGNVEKSSADGVTATAHLASRVAGAETGIDLLVKFFGLKAPLTEEGKVKRRMTVGGMEWWQALATIGGAILGALSAWKYLEPAIAAFNHALLTR